MTQNILIGYTKWLLKWVVIIVMVIGIVIGVIAGFASYNEQVIPMVSIECALEKETSKNAYLPGKRHYLIQKIRNSSLPYAMYRPAYYRSPVTLDTKPEEFYQQRLFDTESARRGISSRYRFGRRTDGSYHEINRDTLQVIYFLRSGDGEHKSTILGKCRQITYEEFLRESERGLKEIQSKLKF